MFDGFGLVCWFIGFACVLFSCLILVFLGGFPLLIRLTCACVITLIWFVILCFDCVWGLCCTVVG